jgi:TolB-like protein
MSRFVLLAWLSTTALAAERPPLIVQDVEARAVTPLQAQAASASIARGLRELDVFQVLSSEDVRQLLAIERSRQILGIEKDGLAQLGESLGADHAVVGTLSKVGDKFQVEMRLLDTAKGSVLSQKSLGPVGAFEQIAKALPGLSQELVSPLLQAQRGSLMVQTREEAAEILVDEVLVGSTPLKAPIPLSRGQHRLQVRKDGFIAQSSTVKIEPDQTFVQQVTLLPSGDYAEAYQLRHSRLRTAAWITAAGAAASLIGAVALDRLSTDPLYLQQFAPRRQFLRGMAGEETQIKPATFEGGAMASASWDTCSADVSVCREEAERLGGQLMLQQLSTVGLVLVGIAGSGVATYLFLTGKDPNRYMNVTASAGPVGDGAAFVLSGRF